jgi:multidrug resistance efflux pump
MQAFLHRAWRASHLNHIRWGKNLALAVVLVFGTTSLTLMALFAPEPDRRQVSERVYPVTTVTAEPGQHSPTLTLYGKVVTPRTSSLTAAVSSEVRAVMVTDGMSVHRGQSLIELDDTDGALNLARMEADLLEAEASLLSLQQALTDNRLILDEEVALGQLAVRKASRYRRLGEDQAISEEVLNAALSEGHRQSITLQRQQALVNDLPNQIAQAEAGVKRARARFQEALVLLDRTRINAPFDGRVISVSVSPGERVSPGTDLAVIYDSASLEIRAQIPERHLSDIRQALASGQPIEGETVDSSSPQRITLTRLGSDISPGKTSVDGLFALKNDGLELGRVVQFSVQLPPIDNTVLLPIEAIYGGDRVFIVTGQRLEAIQVDRLGERRADNGRHSILVRSSQIDPGTSIVVSQLANGVTGMKVSQPTSKLADVKSATAPGV